MNMLNISCRLMFLNGNLTRELAPYIVLKTSKVDYVEIPKPKSLKRIDLYRRR